MRSWIRCVSLVTVLCTCAALPARAAKRPNVLVLFADDQRADTIAAHGNPHIRTPNLDSLVASGFSFRNNYCYGSNSGAVCVPSRAMLNSGRMWMHINNNLNGEKILPELLRENGYTTFATGKWHNQAPAILRGFEIGRSVYMGGMSDHTEVFLQDIDHGKLTNKRIGDGFSSTLFADAAVDFITSHGDATPFYAYVAFTAPHDPRQPPVAFREMYYQQRPPLPKNFLPQHPFDNGQMKLRDEYLAAWPRPADVISDQLCEYYGLITHLDEQIGRVLAALRESGQADNTIIVYAADHGLAMGSHGLLGKQSVYEHSMKCPLVFTGPGIPAGGETKAFSYLLDIYPTVCWLVGVPGPNTLEGHNLSAIWTGKTDRVRDAVFLPFQNLQRSVRDERWKLICYPQINHMQLFDLQNDPDEMTSLSFGIPEHARQRDRLLKMLKQWQADVGDRQPLTVANPKPKAINLTGFKRVPDRWQPDWIREKYFDGVAASEPDRTATEKQRAEFGRQPAATR